LSEDFRFLFPLWSLCIADQVQWTARVFLRLYVMPAVGVRCCVLLSARHVALTTLCSRACRVVLGHPSFVLRGLFESASLELVNVSKAFVLA
jgi:hypothetical protein